jgi:hypothetical protein
MKTALCSDALQAGCPGFESLTAHHYILEPI